MTAVVFGERALRSADIADIAAGRAQVSLSRDAAVVARLQRTRDVVEHRVQHGPPIYGVATGFGRSARTSVPAEYANLLAQNLPRYHGCGTGALLRPHESAAVLACRLGQLTAGWSGIRYSTLQALTALLERGVLPCIPELGSVGASGDLTPLSYVAAVLQGEREAYFQGEILPAAEALRRAELTPHLLEAKESLSIMNGTSVMTALACLGVQRARRLATGAAAVTALMVSVTRGRPDHFDERIFHAKAHPGSVQSAAEVRAFLGVPARPVAAGHGLQDAYSLRCLPHVAGVLHDALRHGEEVLQIELAGAGDNPLVCAETGDILHGGNFYGGHVAYVADGLKTAVASTAEILERQLVLLNAPERNGGLPENLVMESSDSRVARHGFKAMEILSSSLVAEALKHTMPATSFSRSTEGHNQDKVSMGTIATRDLRTVLDLSETVWVVSLLAALQAADLRGGADTLPPPLQPLYHAVRGLAAALVDDRRQDLDIERVRQAFTTDQLPLHIAAFAKETL